MTPSRNPELWQSLPAEKQNELKNIWSSSPSKRNWKPSLWSLKTTRRLEVDGRSYMRRNAMEMHLAPCVRERLAPSAARARRKRDRERFGRMKMTG